MMKAQTAVPHERHEAVMFDLFTALLNSWSLWNEVAGSERLGMDWRTRYLQMTYQAGSYRSYEGIRQPRWVPLTSPLPVS